MKEFFALPEPKDEGLVKYLNGQLKRRNIHPLWIRTKDKKNEVHICGTTEEKVKEGKALIKEFIARYHEQLNEDLGQNVDCTIVELLSHDVRCVIMGKKGATINAIAKKTGTDIQIKQKAAHIKGELHQRKMAEIEIMKIVNKVACTEGKTKVTIPSNVMGRVIGTRHSNLQKVRDDTGAIIQVIEKDIYVSGEVEDCKKAILQLKKIAAEIISRTGRFSCDAFDFIDGIGTKCDYELKPVDCPNPHWNQDKQHFEICMVDEEREGTACEINTEQLKQFVNKVLEKIQGKNDENGEDEKIPKADFWCHFGHIYIGNVDEADQSERYSLEEIQKQVNSSGQDGWKMRFHPAIKDMEIDSLVEALSNKPDSMTVHPHIRYDLQFLTPAFSKLRVKIFLDLEGKPNMEFSKEDIDIRENETASSSPYLLCDNFYHRAKVSIAIPFRRMDVRLTIRTVSPGKHDQEEDGYEETLREYLDKIEIKEGEMVLPDDKEMPSDFCLQYWRKCQRKSYRYDQGQDGFSVTISEEEEMDVIKNDRFREEDRKTKIDIHVHSDEWDRLLTSGDWEPKQIVSKLPQFLSVLRDIQMNISAPQEE